MTRRFEMGFYKLKDKLLHVRVKSDQRSGERSPSESLAGNRTFFQGFEWYLPSDGKHYRRLSYALGCLKDLGVDQVWIPPGCKACWTGSNGYDVYDAYDLGEFDQKGSQRTKFGKKEDLMQLSNHAREIGMKLCWDAILNHRCGADYTEKCQAVKVDIQGMCSLNIGSISELTSCDRSSQRYR